MLRRCAVIAATVVVALAAVAAGASAWSELEIEGMSRERIRQTSAGAITFREGGTNFAVCNLTLIGSLTPARVRSALPVPIGSLSRIESSGCQLEIKLGLPWTIFLEKILPASGAERGEAVPAALINGALLGFREAGGRRGEGLLFRESFLTCLYGGELRTLFTIMAGTWSSLEILVNTQWRAMERQCEPTITLVGGFNPPEPAQRLNFR